MFSILLPLLFLNFFSFFNLLGIKKELLVNQIVFFFIGICFFFLAKKVGIFFFRNNAKFFYWLFIFLLVVTFVIGSEIRGSRRWIDFYIFFNSFILICSQKVHPLLVSCGSSIVTIKLVFPA